MSVPRRRRTVEALAASRGWRYRRRAPLAEVVPRPHRFLLFAGQHRNAVAHVVGGAAGDREIQIFDCRLSTVALIRHPGLSPGRFVITARREWWIAPGRPSADGRFYLFADDPSSLEPLLAGEVGRYLRRPFRGPAHLEVKDRTALVCHGRVCEDNWARLVDAAIGLAALIAPSS